VNMRKARIIALKLSISALYEALLGGFCTELEEYTPSERRLIYAALEHIVDVLRGKLRRLNKGGLWI